MIKLTFKSSNEPIYINIEGIRSISTSPEGTFIHYMHGNFTVVTESPSEVARLITEYKQRQMRLQAAYGRYYSGHLIDEMADEVAKLESEDRGE